MYLLYLDDSGSTSTPEEYMVLGGIAVPENAVHWLTQELDSLAQGTFPSNPVEFHASEILNARKPPWKGLPREDRIKIMKQVLGVTAQAYLKMPVFACAIHKPSYPARDAVEEAFEDLTSRFDMFLNRINRQENSHHRGIIVFDKTSYESGLQKLAISFREAGTRWRRLSTICEVPFFVDSKASRIIQLADHIAYAVFRRYEREDLRFFNVIESLFDAHEGIIHGLCHRQHIRAGCTCPGCATRSTATTRAH